MLAGKNLPVWLLKPMKETQNTEEIRSSRIIHLPLHVTYHQDFSTEEIIE